METGVGAKNSPYTTIMDFEDRSVAKTEFHSSNCSVNRVMKLEPVYWKKRILSFFMAVLNGALSVHYIYTDLVSIFTVIWILLAIMWLLEGLFPKSFALRYPSLSIEDETYIHCNWDEKVLISDISEFLINRFNMKFKLRHHSTWHDPIKVRTRIYKSRELLEFQKKVKYLIEENKTEQSVATDAQ
ncbi:MAG: hypothetical protein GY854_10750 [Deltaproteobacteria bacterium]|nr:hypothetical protein [Deltaproteobacteria bacterium]